jgi:hypothetical protein
MPGTGSVYKLIVHQLYRNQVRVQNVFHVRLNVAGALFDASSVTATFVNNVLPTWRGNITSVITFTHVEAIQIHPSGGDSHSRDIQLTGTFSPPGIFSAYPVVCAGVITWRTGTPTRSGRGRTYVAGLYLGSGYDGRFFGTTEITNLTNIANALKNAFGGNPLNGFEFGVWSRKRAGQTPPFNPDAFQPITAFTIQQYIATMGSRRLGHGI